MTEVWKNGNYITLLTYEDSVNRTISLQFELPYFVFCSAMRLEFALRSSKELNINSSQAV